MRKKTIAELTLMSAEEYRRSAKLPVVVVADSVRSLHNVGSLFRTVDALGLEGMVLCGITGCPPHPLLAKTALGAEQTVEWRYEADAVQACAGLRRQGRELVVLEQAEGSVPLQLWNPGRTRPIALVVGNEVTGVNQTIVDMADTVVEIPQRGTKHSLNVSVSAAMALWEWVR